MGSDLHAVAQRHTDGFAFMVAKGWMCIGGSFFDSTFPAGVNLFKQTPAMEGQRARSAPDSNSFTNCRACRCQRKTCGSRCKRQRGACMKYREMTLVQNESQVMKIWLRRCLIHILDLHPASLPYLHEASLQDSLYPAVSPPECP